MVCSLKTNMLCFVFHCLLLLFQRKCLYSALCFGVLVLLVAFMLLPQIECGRGLGENGLTCESLRKDGYEAVFVGIGMRFRCIFLFARTVLCRDCHLPISLIQIQHSIGHDIVKQSEEYWPSLLELIRAFQQFLCSYRTAVCIGWKALLNWTCNACASSSVA